MNPLIKNEADLLEAAAYEIEKRGWTTNVYYNEEGNVCMTGAILAAFDGQSLFNDTVRDFNELQCSLIRSTTAFAANHLYPGIYHVEEISTVCIAEWNDTRCHSQEQAIEKLRELAKLAHEELGENNA